VLKQCGKCGFVYLENPPEYEELETDFAWERIGKERQERVYRQSPVRTGASRTARMLRDRLVSRADPLVRRVGRWFPPGPVVDIGCGKGDKLASLPERFELVGIEISQEQARVARERLAARGVVITLGAAGMVAAGEDGDPVLIPAAPEARVTDPTGAGDTVAAAVTAGLLGGGSILESALLGELAARLVIRQLGVAVAGTADILAEAGAGDG